ncbi:hypothetical protein SEA_EVAA_23 [Gordonia phage Evaa]|nr:hypothetical protein SEA_EVAA_23 [Gordonia phage Evaa]
MSTNEPTARVSIDPAALAAVVRPILSGQMSSLTRRIATQARADVPVRTGNLGRSIREDPVVFRGPFRVESGVTATAPYAAAVHEGTRPHVIRPRRGNVLAFDIGGRTIFAREVHHPGTRARPFLRNAAERIAGENVQR